MSDSKRVALSVTCIVDQLFPEIGVATVELLRMAGYSVEFPEKQTCCGQPFSNSGFMPEAVKMAKQNIELFEPYDYIVLPNGSCTAMMRVEYLHYLENDPQWHTRAEALSKKTYELSEFLVRVADWKPVASPNAPSVTFHASCHTKRLLGMHETPRALLAAAGCKIIEMEDPDRCCGFGGVFCVRMADISNAMTRTKLDLALKTGADLMVTVDPGCMMQMQGLLKEKSTTFRIQHLANFLLEVSK
jgi:L-lactate dehydrogenase complex protein LldE